jgi:hypothetical protein
MNTNLWCKNGPRDFWQVQPDPGDEDWQNAVNFAYPWLGLPDGQTDIDTVLNMTLGEGRFGKGHWNLGALKKGYYLVKPLVPRPLSRRLRQIYQGGAIKQEGWPVERRYVDYLWVGMRQVLIQSGQKELFIKCFWPNHCTFAFVLTHDVETAAGQEFVKVVADLEESLGFHSSFNFVPNNYKLDLKLMDDLRQRGFEVGVHGLNHDGKLFDSKSSFMQKSASINKYLKEWGAVGFRAELTLRQPEWMQALDIEYDLSFFDTDPFEPVPGGTMSIWPFFIGHFVELPYTLVQDNTLTSVLGEKSPRIWLEKVDFIEEYHGMALINSHPDFLKSKPTWNVYCDFLNEMKNRNSYWHALPCEVARWWKGRSVQESNTSTSGVTLSKALLDGENIKISA